MLGHGAAKRNGDDQKQAEHQGDIMDRQFDIHDGAQNDAGQRRREDRDRRPPRDGSAKDPNPGAVGDDQRHGGDRDRLLDAEHRRQPDRQQQAAGEATDAVEHGGAIGDHRDQRQRLEVQLFEKRHETAQFVDNWTLPASLAAR